MCRNFLPNFSHQRKPGKAKQKTSSWLVAAGIKVETIVKMEDRKNERKTDRGEYRVRPGLKKIWEPL